MIPTHLLDVRALAGGSDPHRWQSRVHGVLQRCVAGITPFSRRKEAPVRGHAAGSRVLTGVPVRERLDGPEATYPN